jgi:hypothetical protein
MVVVAGVHRILGPLLVLDGVCPVDAYVFDACGQVRAAVRAEEQRLDALGREPRRLGLALVGTSGERQTQDKASSSSTKVHEVLDGATKR